MSTDLVVRPEGATAGPLTGARTLSRSRAVRIGGGIVVIVVLVGQLGAGPFLDGLRATSLWAVLAALVLTAAATWCCALRWSLVSARTGERLPFRAAYVAYYRSQVINATLPGGVVGDVHRGVRYGLRSVVLERTLGQLVQLTMIGLVLLPAPYRWFGLATLVLVAAGTAARGGLLVLLSAGSTLAHLAVFLVAAEAAGVSLSAAALLPIGALVLLGSSIPLNVAGWGPREGVAAWAFTAFGSTAATGLTVSVTFGVLAMIATLPGLLVLGSRHG